jgi:hypothetical protein
MYPPSIDVKHPSRYDVKGEYHQVQLTQGRSTRKFIKIVDGRIKIKLPLNI